MGLIKTNKTGVREVKLSFCCSRLIPAFKTLMICIGLKEQRKSPILLPAALTNRIKSERNAKVRAIKGNIHSRIALLATTNTQTGLVQITQKQKLKLVKALRELKNHYNEPEISLPWLTTLLKL